MQNLTETAPSAGRARTLVAMSGGVDSSVVAALLAEQGLDCVGVSMRLYASGSGGPAKGCCSPDDLFDARTVAANLGLPFYVVNYQEEFERRVIAHFVDEYRRGRTPSPCVLCNDHLKFDTLLGLAESIDAEALATGHYARVERDETGRWRLLRGVDREKDQSYFLFGIRREVLPRLRFPLGGLTKAETRALAERFDLPTADKAESQDLCFVGGGSYLAFLDQRLVGDDKPRPGDIVHCDTGEVLGRHDGVHRYTIGQRRGIGVGAAEPLYVVALRAESAEVVVGPRERLARPSCVASRCNWLAFERLAGPERVEVQVRYRHRPVGAVVVPLDGGGAGGRVRVDFDEPERALAPGQAAVFYRGDEVLGGGWIDET